MLKYIEKSTDANVTNGDIASIQRIVTKVKEKKEVSINYMKSWEHDKMVYDDGVQQGIEIGMERGIEQGIERGIQGMIQTCQELQVSREETVSKLIQKFELDFTQAEEHMRKYWQEQ